MQFRSFQPLVEVFLLVEQPRQRLSHWSHALAPIDDATAPAVASIDAYFDPTTNQAILALRYDELALGPGRLGFLVDLALVAEMGMIQPAELSEGDRKRFVGERLARCTVHVPDQRKVVSALVELVRQLREQQRAATPTGERPQLVAAGVPLRGRGDTRDPFVLLPKGTRRFASPDDARLPAPTRDLARGSVRQPKLERPAAAPDVPEAAPDVPEAVPDDELKRVITEPIAMPVSHAAEGTAVGEVRRRPSPHVIARTGIHRATTVTMSPEQTQQMLEAANPTAEPRAPRGSAVSAEPFPPLASAPVTGTTIFGRYERQGRWVPTRIGSLSLKSAVLMAGAMPRVDDHVDIALSFLSHRALVRGAVEKVSTSEEAEASGATSFTVRFVLDEKARRQLTVLLKAARAANVTLKPPPPRSTRRYPVEWPLRLGTARGAVRGDALDVSSAGMFVRPQHPLIVGESVAVTVALDDGLAPVSGRARVVRSFSEAEAKVAGLSAGYGLAIVEMSEPDLGRWHAFLGRVDKRASKRVWIGASPARVAELQGGLVAAGYAVTYGTSPGEIAQLANTQARLVDAALIDATWLGTGSSPADVESLFTGRKVPCVTMQGDARRARLAIDRLLAVV